MTGPRLAAIALAGVLLATLTGCPATPDRAATEPTNDSATAPRPALDTDATTDLPAYAGPPAGAPASAGPLTTLRATVDLTPATPTVFSVPGAAAATPDGRVLVVLSPVDHTAPRLATVGPTGDTLAVTGAVPLPPFESVAGLDVLPDGRAAVLGELPPAGGRPGGGGGAGVGGVPGALRPADAAPAGCAVAVVDPATGAARTTVAVPFDPHDVDGIGRSALS